MIGLGRLVPERERPRSQVAVGWPLAMYAGLALVIWGPWLLEAPGSTLLADNDIDPSVYLWFFSWWPHALLEGLNPFYTELIFVPEGYNLAWVTSMPGPSLLLAPVTTILGPVATFNLISLAAPALSAWTAFLLCRHVTGALGPSLAGGYLFGFSPYMLGALTGAPQLAFVALAPVAVLLVLRHVDGSMSDRRFVLAMTVVLTAQIYTSTELLATIGVFGGITLALAYLLFGAQRSSIRRAVLCLGLAGLATAALAAPLLYYVVFGERTLPEHALSSFPADLASLAVPGSLVALAPQHIGLGNPSWTPGSSYLGLPLLILVGLFAWRHRDSRAAWLAVLVVAVGAVAMLGDVLHVAGHRLGVPLPWAVFVDLPLVRYAIPLRFSMFAFLAAAVVLAMWVAWRPSRARWALVALVLLSLFPAVGSDAWHTKLIEAPFFADDGYEQFLEPEDRVLTIPVFGRNMYWQAQAGFSFRMAAGYVGQDPASYTRFPFWNALSLGRLGVPARPTSALSPTQLRRFISAKGVTVIVAEGSLSPPLRRLFEGLGTRAVDTGGVLVYRIAPPPRA